MIYDKVRDSVQNGLAVLTAETKLWYKALMPIGVALLLGTLGQGVFAWLTRFDITTLTLWAWLFYYLQSKT